MPRAFIFDMDGVLCQMDNARRLGYLAKLSGRTPDQVRHAIFESGFEDRSDAGEYTADEYLAEFGNRIGYPITHEEWCAYRKAGMTPDLHVLAIARHLSKSATVAVLTDNGHQLKRSFPTIFPELPEIFEDRLHVSADYKALKPDPSIFIRVCSHLDVAPSEAMMIDDRIGNAHGAIAAGLRGHHFQSAARLAAELKIEIH